jgi:hypothetical protein
MAKVAILGQQGTGKSLLGVFLSRKIQYSYSGVTIYTNMNIDPAPGMIQVTDLSQIPFDRSPKILIIDEAMFTIDSRSHSSKQNKIWTRAQAFFRKANFLLVLYITHSADLIDNRMRKQLNYVIMCRKDKEQFQYLVFDMLTKNTKPFSLPKNQKIFNFANFDTHDFPPPISVDGLSENILFKIAK